MPIPLFVCRSQSAALLSALALCCALLIGCVSAPKFPAAPPATLNLSVAEGRPTALRSGANFSYWVWRDAEGWHLRTTSARKDHKFQGRIRAQTPGAISDIKAVSMEHNKKGSDRLSLDGGELVFQLFTSGKNDGFDFKVSRGGCVEFFLQIDGDSDPTRIYLGQNQTRPPSTHFTLCP